MNNNIQEDYCSFEVSKLLAERGFDVRCSDYYFEGRLYPVVKQIANNSVYLKNDAPYFHRPTHALAIKWIRVNSGVRLIIDSGGIGSLRWTYNFYAPGWTGSEYVIKKKLIENRLNPYFNTPEEATEAALLYTLKNLI
jgi:hypothetical protein